MDYKIKRPPKSCLIISLISIFSLLLKTSCYSQSTDFEKAIHYIQTRGEVYFSFIADKSDIETISHLISIDRINNDTVYSYANYEEFNQFLNKKYAYTVLTPPSLLLPESKLVTGFILKDWDVYPTYDAYVIMMNGFAENYPDLCQLHEIGTTVNGRKLLGVKISDNVNIKESEPEFFFTSTMHGDEVTGYILMLRLIDYLLSNYGVLPEVTRLVDSIEIWINPNANPDGTYFSGNQTVAGAIRYNANFVDLNRNFPDPDTLWGDHPDGNAWQPETMAMMQFMQNHNFVFSANYHGGAEVLNYPWDTWSRSHPDEEWFEYVSHQYADTVKKYGGSSYFSNVSPDGVTNGYDWYPIAGGRQDYTTYFCNGREITIEVSSVKMPAAELLPDYWNYNYIAMLDYIGQCLRGIHGLVTDSITGNPLKAKIVVMNHDADSSHVYSNELNGDHHRLIAPGTYDILCSAPGYYNKIKENVVVTNWTSSEQLNFELHANSIRNEAINQVTEMQQNLWFGSDGILYFTVPEPQKIIISLYNIEGILLESHTVYALSGQNHIYLSNEYIANSLYILKIQFEKSSEKILKIYY